MANENKRLVCDIDVNVEVSNSPVFWFCLLETAKKKQDYEQASEAMKELKRLGVDVHYIQQKRQKEKVA